MAITQHLPNFTFTDRGVHGKFDADLYIPDGNNNPNDLSANAVLAITLKVCLKQDNTGTGRTLSAPYKFAPWPATQWNSFIARFTDSANFWQNRFWLVLDPNKINSTEYRAIKNELAVPEMLSIFPRTWLSYRRNIKCNFRLQIVDSAAHKTLNVQYIVDATGSPIHSQYTHRSDDSNVDVGDTHSDSNSMNCISHEIGHLLGLAHIGVVTDYAPCVAVISTSDGGNNDVCYNGATDTYTDNIMGHGGKLDYRQSLPWRRAFDAMSGVPLTYYIVHPMAYTPKAAGAPETIIDTGAWYVPWNFPITK